jgi:hypothetical protein
VANACQASIKVARQTRIKKFAVATWQIQGKRRVKGRDKFDADFKVAANCRDKRVNTL